MERGHVLDVKRKKRKTRMDRNKEKKRVGEEHVQDGNGVSRRLPKSARDGITVLGAACVRGGGWALEGGLGF